MQQIRNFRQNKKTFILERLRICYLNLAGDESDASNPLLADFIVTGRKLEQLGFTYHKGNVTIVDVAAKLGHEQN